MEKNKQNLYSKIIYPAIYEEEYEEPVQQSMFDDEEDIEDSDIDIANKYARTKTQFKPGNKYRYQKQERPIEGQEEIEIEEDNDEI